MPRQTKDRDSTWQIDGSNKTYVLTAKATISVEEDSGIVLLGDGNAIEVEGQVFADGAGIHTPVDDSRIMVASGGRIDAALTGIDAGDTSGLFVVNHGLIGGGGYGIFVGAGTIRNSGDIMGGILGVFADAETADIRNSGRITGGENGIEASSGKSDILNTGKGEIIGQEAAVDFRLGGIHTLKNNGFILGREASVTSTDGTLVWIENRGEIVGDIRLGNGNDFIDTRHGIVRGEVNGGEGDDTYLVSDARIRITENGASFHDEVRSTVSYKLGGYLDVLGLLGSRNIDGTGNGGDNSITGNKANNRLDGGAGEDILSGREGNDRLTGGADADMFHYIRGFGIDRVTDYVDGTDHFLSADVMTQEDFDRLDITQSGDDTVIDFGKGDRLILIDIDHKLIDLGDFLIP